MKNGVLWPSETPDAPEQEAAPLSPGERSQWPDSALPAAAKSKKAQVTTPQPREATEAELVAAVNAAYDRAVAVDGIE